MLLSNRLYLNKRRSFPRSFPRRFEAASDRANPERTWYEIQLGQVDNRPLYMLYQIDDACTFVRRLPAAMERQAQLRECVNAFVLTFIARAARLLHANTDTARGGVGFLRHDVDRSYRIMPTEYDRFCRLLSNVLATKSLRAA